MIFDQNNPKDIAAKLVDEFGVPLALDLAKFCQKEFFKDRDPVVIDRWDAVKRALEEMSKFTEPAQHIGHDKRTD